MSSLLAKSFDVRRGEGSRVFFMFTYVFLIITSYYILKPMTRSLFMKHLGPEQLPLVYMIVALVVGAVAVVYARLASRFPLPRLVLGTTIFFISNLLLFWWLLHTGFHTTWLYYTFYVWTSTYGVLITSQFWLLANYLFNAREAKRLFPLLTAGAISGGIVGGYVTTLLVARIGGTANLSFFCIGFLATSLVLMYMAWKQRESLQIRRSTFRVLQQEAPFLQVVRDVLGTIRNSRHLAVLMAIIAMTVMVSQIADFQFVTFANEEIAQTDDLTGFLGFWLSNLSVISLIFQLLLASVIIRRFGVAASLLLLPLVLLATSLWVFVGYGLVSVLAIKIGDGAFRHSINRAGVELLFLPLPSEVKRKTKTFVDMFADRFARGFSGLILLVAYTWLGLSVAQISLVSVALIAVWLALVWTSRREYVDSFRQALAKRRIDADAMTETIKDEATVKMLVESLKSDNQRQVVYALQLLESAQGVDLEAPLRPLLHHPAHEVRHLALRVLGQSAHGDLLADVQELLHDPDEEVRRAAVRYYLRFTETTPADLLKAWLSAEDEGLRGAALYCVAEQKELARELVTTELLESFLRGSTPLRKQLADAVGALEQDDHHRVLQQLLEDPDPEVRKRAIASAGRIRKEELVPLLLGKLANRADRSVAIEALARYGDAILDALCDQLNDRRVPLQVRRTIPRVMALIGSQRTVNVLLTHLNQPDEMIRYQIIKAMNKLRARFPQLRFGHGIQNALFQEIRKYYRLLAMLNFTENDNRQNTILCRALRERLDDHLERTFRLLGLRYPARDIYNAYLGTRSANQNVRANAIEFLDNILSRKLRQAVLPLVENPRGELAVQQGNGLVDLSLKSTEEALQHLATDSDPWLRTCTLYEIGCRHLHRLRPVVEAARNDEDPMVRETAQVVLERFLT